LAGNASAAGRRAVSPERQNTAMVEELEQEYAALKDKVRDLREYL
jgi:hypothetical protein